MQQLELFDYRKDYLFDNKNQVAHWYDILKETEDTISYAEHIDPNKGYAIAGMEYEEYVDVKKDRLKGNRKDDSDESTVEESSKEIKGRWDQVAGLEHLDRLIEINQSPIGRTPRSNPATYTKVFDLIRDLFTMLPESRIRGYNKGRFSFNVKGGRC